MLPEYVCLMGCWYIPGNDRTRRNVKDGDDDEDDDDDDDDEWC